MVCLSPLALRRLKIILAQPKADCNHNDVIRVAHTLEKYRVEALDTRPHCGYLLCIGSVEPASPRALALRVIRC